MKEQSHKDEMSKALRGDFERLRERGVSVTLAPRETESAAPEPVASAEPAVEAPPEPDAEPAIVEPPAPELPEPEAAVPEPEMPPEAEVSGEPETSEPGWLGRLFGR